MGVIYVASQAALVVTLSYELFGMRIGEWAQVGLVVLALMFAYTSVLYGRARAYEQGPVKRRTLYAADLALRALIFYLIAVALIAIVHLLLVQAGFEPEPRNLNKPEPSHIWPVVWFFPTVILVMISFANLFDSLRAISFRFLVLINFRRFVRNSSRRQPS